MTFKLCSLSSNGRGQLYPVTAMAVKPRLNRGFCEVEYVFHLWRVRVDSAGFDATCLTTRGAVEGGWHRPATIDLTVKRGHGRGSALDTRGCKVFTVPSCALAFRLFRRRRDVLHVWSVRDNFPLFRTDVRYTLSVSGWLFRSAKRPVFRRASLPKVVYC